MEIKVLKFDGKILRFSVKKGDFTLGNLVQRALLDDNRILGAGFYIAHPLTMEMIFTVFFKKDVSFEEAKKIVVENTEKIKKYIVNLKNQTIKAIYSS